MDSMIYIALFISGLTGGILAGMFGIGGGLVYTFIIPIFFKWKYPDLEISSEIIIANSIVGVLFASASSSIRLILSKQFYLREVVIASCFAITSSYIASITIVEQPWYSERFFRITLLVLILTIALKLLFEQKSKIKRKESKLDLPIIGFSGGIIAALSGFGGGVVMVPVMLFLGAFDIHKAKNISLGVIAINALFLVVRAIQKPNITDIPNSFGNILPLMCIAIIAGTIVGGPIGINLSKNIKKQALLRAYLILLSVLMIYYLYQILQ